MNFTASSLEGSITIDFTVAQLVEYVQLDTIGNTIQQVNLLPAGSAMRATLNKGIVPVVNNTLIWDVKSPNPVTGDVLVVQLNMNYTAGALFSL